MKLGFIGVSFTTHTGVFNGSFKTTNQRRCIMKKKLLILDEEVLKDVKKRFGGGRFALASDSAFLRMLLEKTQEKINRR